MLRRLLLVTLLLLLGVGVRSARTAPEPLQAAKGANIWPALERLEDVRLLFHVAMYQVHEARALALQAEPVTVLRTKDTVPTPEGPYAPGSTIYERYHLPDSLRRLDDLAKEGLWIYESVSALDESAQSLCSYRDSGKAPYLAEDLRQLETGTARLAQRVLAYYEKTARAKEERRKLAVAALVDGPPQLREVEGLPWPGAEREWGRKNGPSIGWPMLFHPHDDSAQALLSKVHGLDTEYLLRKARKVGVGHVLVLDPDAASWRGCEPVQGRVDFRNLDGILEEVQRSGLKAILHIPSLTSACPAWFKDPAGAETSFVASDGSARSGAGVFLEPRRGRDQFSVLQERGRDKGSEAINLHNPSVRAAFQKYLDALGKHLQERWRGTLLGVQLESNVAIFGTRTYDGRLRTDLDYSRFAVASWRDFLGARYGTVQSLNRAWGTALPSFDALDLLKPLTFEPSRVAAHGANSPTSLSSESRAYVSQLPARERFDFLDWRDAYVVSYFQLQATTLRRALPDLPITMDVEDFDGETPLLDRPEFAWSAAQLAQKVTDLPQGMSSAGWAGHLLRAHARLRNPVSPTWTASQSDGVFGRGSTQNLTGPYYKDALLLNQRFGPAGALRCFPELSDCNYADQQLSSEGANGAFLAGRENQAVAPEMLNSQVARGQVGILWPDASLRWDPDTLVLREAQCWGEALRALGYSYDYVVEANLYPEALSGYQTLVLPAAQCLSDRSVQAVRAFVQGGGRLVATSTPGIRDELGKTRAQWPLADVLGVDRPRFVPVAPVPGTPLGITQPRDGAALRQSAEDLTYAGRLTCTYDRALPESDSFRILHRFADGSPAVVHRRFGQGQALLMGYPFGNEYGWSNYDEIAYGSVQRGAANPVRRQMEGWLRRQLEALGLRPVCEAALSVTLRRAAPESAAGSRTAAESFLTGYELTEDQPESAVEFVLREREGVETRYLCVWNREAPQPRGNGSVEAFAAPKYLTLRINLPGVQSLWDIQSRTPVRFESRGAEGVVFRTSLAPGMGRVFAFSTAREIVLFRGERSRGVQDAELLSRVRESAGQARAAESLTILHEAEVRAALGALKGKAVRIGCGSGAYLELGEELAAQLGKRLACQAEVTLADVQHSAATGKGKPGGADGEDLPEILVGNATDNSCIGYLTSSQGLAERVPRLFMPLSVTQGFPGSGRGVLQVSRPYQAVDRRQRPEDQPAFYRFDPAPPLIIVAGSDVTGTAAAVKACIERIPTRR